MINDYRAIWAAPREVAHPSTLDAARLTSASLHGISVGIAGTSTSPSQTSVPSAAQVGYQVRHRFEVALRFDFIVSPDGSYDRGELGRGIT